MENYKEIPSNERLNDGNESALLSRKLLYTSMLTAVERNLVCTDLNIKQFTHRGRDRSSLTLSSAKLAIHSLSPRLLRDCVRFVSRISRREYLLLAWFRYRYTGTVNAISTCRWPWLVDGPRSTRNRRNNATRGRVCTPNRTINRNDPRNAPLSTHLDFSLMELHGGLLNVLPIAPWIWSVLASWEWSSLRRW